ncbi:hypothetical protein ACFE04_011409 [Oxalis oulophora]
MEYERITKVQSGLISPSKLRMKLMGPHNKKKDGSNNNSSRTSPVRLEDSEFVNNSLLANGDFDDEAVGLEIVPVMASSESTVDSRKGYQSKDSVNKDSMGNRGQHLPKVDSSAIYPMRFLEDENLDYDSNASSSSFEFHKGDNNKNNNNNRSGTVHHHITRSFSRPTMSSKWNDAEKWIMNRQNVQPKKNVAHGQGSRMPVTNMGRVAPEYASFDNRFLGSRAAETKCVDVCQSTAQTTFDKFSFVPSQSQPESSESEQVNSKEISCTMICSEEDMSVVPNIRSVCMRDMGTEMTPATSLEPSRTATPVGSITPGLSPNSSMPSTPRRNEPAPTPLGLSLDGESDNREKELSEQETKLKTRREIVALGVQLGKMNIAAWASKDEKNASSVQTAEIAEREQIEYENRAAAWEEAEKSKHNARYKREEIRIQAWESQQKAKLEAEMRKIEAKVEQVRAQAQAKMVQKIAMAGQRSEEKRAAAEARKLRNAERTAAQTEYIRQTGRIPSSDHHLSCCGWLS